MLLPEFIAERSEKHKPTTKANFRAHDTQSQIFLGISHVRLKLG